MKRYICGVIILIRTNIYFQSRFMSPEILFEYVILILCNGALFHFSDFVFRETWREFALAGVCSGNNWNLWPRNKKEKIKYIHLISTISRLQMVCIGSIIFMVVFRINYFCRREKGVLFSTYRLRFSILLNGLERLYRAANAKTWDTNQSMWK